MSDTLRSAQADPAMGGPMGGGSMEQVDIGAEMPKLESAQSSVAFQMSGMGVDLDIPGNLMTCMNLPEDTGGKELRTSYDTPPISK